MIRALALLLLLAGPVFGQAPVPGGLPPGVSAGDQAAIQGVISHQIDAFRHDDATGAYAFAGPNIKRMFPTADGFLEMVRRGYQPVYRPRDLEFGVLGLRDGDLVQEVELVGPDGERALALYTIEKGSDGIWVITGCSLTASARVGV